MSLGRQNNKKGKKVSWTRRCPEGWIINIKSLQSLQVHIIRTVCLLLVSENANNSFKQLFPVVHYSSSFNSFKIRIKTQTKCSFNKCFLHTKWRLWSGSECLTRSHSQGRHQVDQALCFSGNLAPQCTCVQPHTWVCATAQQITHVMW